MPDVYPTIAAYAGEPNAARATLRYLLRKSGSGVQP
jgi:hypothetical protein